MRPQSHLPLRDEGNEDEVMNADDGEFFKPRNRSTGNMNRQKGTALDLVDEDTEDSVRCSNLAEHIDLLADVHVEPSPSSPQV